MKHFYSVSFLFFYFCVSSAFSSLFAQEEYWMQFKRKGTAYSYLHVLRKTSLEKIEYQIEQHVKMDVVGVNPQEIVLTGTFITRKDYTPLSFEFNINTITKKTFLQGTVAENVLSLRITEKDGTVRERKLPFENCYFEPILSDLILERAAEKKFTIKVFEPYDCKITTAQIATTRTPEGDLKATVKQALSSQYLFDKQGHIQSLKYPELNSEGTLVSEVEAKKITFLKTDDGYTLTVKSKNKFPNVYQVTQAKLQLQWKKIAFEAFNLEDNRQKVLEKKEKDGEVEVLLEIKEPQIPATFFLEAIGEEFSPYLKETFYIKPQDTEIQKTLRAIQQETNLPDNKKVDGVKLTQKILRWIQENIAPEMIAETLTGPEVLKEKRGKCSEYAILFASLTRAAGIPTKIVLGERYMGDAWMGHMWNEVWLGKWLTVDPSEGDFIRNPCLLKFVDSDTVEGTQTVRMKLIDNLKIEILDFTEKNADRFLDLKTGIEGNTYSNRNFFCRVSVPDSDWEMKEESSFGHTILTLTHKKEKEVTLAFVFFVLPPTMSIDDLLKLRLKTIASQVKAFRKLEENEIEVAGQRALHLLFQNQGKEKVMINENCIFKKKVRTYLFAYIAPEDIFKSFRAEAQKVFDTFELLD